MQTTADPCAQVATALQPVPSLFWPSVLVPLQPRLEDADVPLHAVAVACSQVDVEDPRYVDPPDATLAILRGDLPPLLCIWPDLTLAWVSLAPMGNVGNAMLAAYAAGRARLERLHLLHDGPAGNA